MKIEKSHVVGNGLHAVGNYMMYEVGASLKRVQPQTVCNVYNYKMPAAHATGSCPKG